MKPNTNNYKNKSKHQIDRTFGATQPLVLPTASTTTTEQTPAPGTSEVNYTSNPKSEAETSSPASTTSVTTAKSSMPAAAPVTTDVNISNNPTPAEHAHQPTSAASNPEPEPASTRTTSRAIPQPNPAQAQAAPATQPLPRLTVKLDATNLLCQLATHQYILTEHANSSSSHSSRQAVNPTVPAIPSLLTSPTSRDLIQRFFKPIYDTGYQYALWLANSKPGLVSSPGLCEELAKNTMLAVWKRATYGPVPQAGYSSHAAQTNAVAAATATQTQTQSKHAQAENLEVITDVPGLITHCFHVEYASYLQSKFYLCKRQTQPLSPTTASPESSRYCNHPDCAPLSPATGSVTASRPALASTLAPGTTTEAYIRDIYELSRITTTPDSPAFAFALDIYEVARLIVPPQLIDRLDSYLKLASPSRRAALRLRMQVAFTRLTQPQRLAVTDRAKGYPVHQIADRHNWNYRQAEKHLQRGKELLRFELTFPGFAPAPLPGRPLEASSSSASSGSGSNRHQSHEQEVA